MTKDELDNIRAVRLAYYHKHKLKISEERKRKYAEHNESIREKKRQKYHEDVNKSRRMINEKYRRNKEYYRAYHRDYRQNHAEQRKETVDRFMAHNKERVRLMQRKSKEARKDQTRLYDKERYKRNREYILERANDRNHTKPKRLDANTDSLIDSSLIDDKSRNPATDIETEQYLQQLFDRETYIDMNISKKLKSSDKIMYHFIRSVLSKGNDTKDIIWSEYGDRQTEKPRKVSVMSADNFIMVVHVKPDDIVNNKFSKYLIIQNAIYEWLRVNNILVIDVKPIRFSMDTKKTYGKQISVPHALFKIATADEDLTVLLNTLSDSMKMKSLNDCGIMFHNIDIKVDYALCLTPDAIHHSFSRAKIEFPGNDIYQEINRSFGNNCVVIVDKTNRTRAKVYNKFVETIESSGVGCDIGDHFHRWACNTGRNLKKAIEDPLTQSRGLTRIEVTFNGTIPCLQRCCEVFEAYENIFLPHCNYTSITKQWKCLPPEHSVMVFDTYTRGYVLGRWFNSKTKQINGISGIANSFVELMHVLKLCTLSSLPVDFYIITSTLTQGGVCLPSSKAPFECFNNSTVLSGVSRNHFQSKKLRLYIRGNPKTHFLRNKTLYNSILSFPDLVRLGITGNNLIIPTISENSYSRNDLLEYIQLTTTDTCFAFENTPIQNNLPDGKYHFINGYVSDDNTLYIAVKGHTPFYKFNSKWKVLEPHFRRNSGFTFYITDGMISMTPYEISTTKPMNLSSLELNHVYTLSTIQNQNQTTVVQFVELPQIAFYSSIELDMLISQGYLKYRTILTTDDQGSNLLALVPY